MVPFTLLCFVAQNRQHFCNMKHICVDPQSEINGGFYQCVMLKSECKGNPCTMFKMLVDLPWAM